MGLKFKGNIVSNYSKEMEWQQGITTGIGFCVYIVLENPRRLCHNGDVVSMPEFKSSCLGSLPRRGKYDLLLNIWYSEPFVKEKQTPHFIFVIWSALVVGGCLMAAWGRKSYLEPVEISSVVCAWLNSRIGDTGWFVCNASPAKFRSAMRGCHQPAFMDILLTIIHTYLPCLTSRWVNPYMFCTPPSHSGASAGSFDIFQGQNYVALSLQKLDIRYLIF